MVFTMGKTLDLGERIELMSADRHCGDISLGLYRQDAGGVPWFLVHTYSSAPGAADRVAFIREALKVMLGLEEDGALSGRPGWLKFACGSTHQRALKRAFLDLCKLETGAALEPKPLKVFDKKANGDIKAVPQGRGTYRIEPDPKADNGPRRATAVARGFVKLCEMAEREDGSIAFACDTDHDLLIGMLMFRAQNVRAAVQEEEMAASKGVLSAPSQQK